MGSTLESCSKSRAELDEFYSRCRKISRKWHFKVGLDDSDLCQDMMVSYVEWMDKVPDAANREAYLMKVIASGLRVHLDKWYAKGAVRDRGASDIDDTDVPLDADVADPLAIRAIHRELEGQPKDRRDALLAVINHDADHEDLGITRRRMNDHLLKFIEHMQDKFGMEKVRRRENITSTFSITNGSLIEAGTPVELSKKLGLDLGNLSKVLNGKKPSVKGWRLA